MLKSFLIVIWVRMMFNFFNQMRCMGVAVVFCNELKNRSFDLGIWAGFTTCLLVESQRLAIMVNKQ